MQNQYDPSSSQYHQPQQPYQQPYLQNYGPPPGHAPHSPAPQPYQQPPGPGGYAYTNPGASSTYYQQPPPAAPPQVVQQNPLPPPSPQPGQARAVPVASSGHGPFAHLCSPGTNTITLTILDKGDKKDFLLAPGASKVQPLYTVKVTKDGTFRSTKMKVQYHDGQSKKPKSVCKFKLHERYAELSFSWLKWDLWPFVEDQQWESDVETRDGHSLEWKFLGSHKDSGWVMRCYDATDAYYGICSVVMTDYYSGKIEIDALSMKNQNGLDEMVCVAMAALNVYRGQISAPDRGGTFPSSSSSSSSDSD